MAIDPIEPALKTKLNTLTRDLRKYLSPDNFTLMVIGKSRLNYISSVQRPSMLSAMREFIAKHEGTEPEVQVACTLTVIPEIRDAPKGVPMALVFTMGDNGVEHMKLVEWKEEIND